MLDRLTMRSPVVKRHVWSGIVHPIVHRAKGREKARCRVLPKAALEHGRNLVFLELVLMGSFLMHAPRHPFPPLTLLRPPRRGLLARSRGADCSVDIPPPSRDFWAGRRGGGHIELPHNKGGSAIPPTHSPSVCGRGAGGKALLEGRPPLTRALGNWLYAVRVWVGGGGQSSSGTPPGGGTGQ